jgi:uncharacterized membrane protein
MPRPLSRLLGVFATGALVALPLAATLAVIAWTYSLVVRFVGPDSAIGNLLSRVGLSVTESEVISYALGIGIVLAAVFGLGLLAEAGLQQGMNRVLHAVLTRIPLVGTLYELLHKMVGLFTQREAEGVKSMSAVWCHFGGPGTADGPGRAAVLGLLSTREAVLIAGRPCLGVIVPTAPVPVGGGLLYLPAEWVSPADIGIEALTSIYVSMGVTTDQYLPKAASQALDGPGLPAAPPGSGGGSGS